MRVSQNVMAVLDRATCNGNALSLATVGQLDRKLYTDTNKVLEAAGGKWNRKAQAHIFDGDAAEAIEPIILTGEIALVKQELQQFDTPPDLARRVVAEAGIKPGMFVLEPSAGLGAIAQAAAEAGGAVRCIEIDASRYDKLSALREAGDIVHVDQGDFLSVPAGSVYDRVVMNPPFTKGQDVRHVMHAARFLKPGGRLVSIMSASLIFRQDRLYSEFRTFLDLHRASVVDLPTGSFKSSGTDVNTCLVSFNALEAR